MKQKITLVTLLTLSVANGAVVSAAPKTKASRPAFEPKAHGLLKKVFDHYRGLRSYSGTMRWMRGGSSLDSLEQLIRSGQTQVRVARPKLYLSSRIDRSEFGQRYVDDGENIYINAMPDDVLRLTHTFVDQDELWKFAHSSDFGIKALLQNRNPLQPYGSYVIAIAPGPERKKGEAHVVVGLRAPNATGQIDYFLGRQDLSLHAVRVHQVVNGKTLDLSEEYSEVQFNPSLTPAQIEPDAEMKRLAEVGRTQPTPIPVPASPTAP